MAFCQNCGTQLQSGAAFCSNCGTAVGATGAEGRRRQEFVGTIKKCPTCGSEVNAFEARCNACGHIFNDVKVDNSVKEFFEKLEELSSESDTFEDHNSKSFILLLKTTLFLLAFVLCGFAVMPDDSWNPPTIPFFITALILCIIGFCLKKPLTQEEKKRKMLIETFIVPNSKESIFEFLVLSASQIDKSGVGIINSLTPSGQTKTIWNNVWKTKISQTIAKASILFANDPQGMQQIETIKKQFKIK